MTEQQSIKETLDVIRKALEEDDTPNLELNTENILVLNKLIKDDGTIKILNEPVLSKEDVVNILEKKLDDIFEKYLIKWLDVNFPKYLEKYFQNKKF